MKRIVVLTGAGMSAQSGISTFRDSGGLWENYPVQQVASIEGWYKNPELMLTFYNQRRTALQEANPNKGHLILAELEKHFHVSIITQNIDDLHERAGSTNVLHLHGELTKARSSEDPDLITYIGYDPIEWGDKATDGSQLRPHVVWFGEPVPNMTKAIQWTQEADIMIVAGTSLAVYPAAGLVDFAQNNIPLFLVDPKPAPVRRKNLYIIADKAVEGLEKLKKTLIENYT
ncbi:MAG TPA: NAD-dependent deacylase [Bacteroidales bacterium]|nr:NAD-dependent deacylase [Bacteroidales bacterium]HRW94441.1 NAD-dependent deacylase [Bacteroidales bacterium]